MLPSCLNCASAGWHGHSSAAANSDDRVSQQPASAPWQDHRQRISEQSSNVSKDWLHVSPSAERDPEGAERGNKTEANHGNARAKRWTYNRMLRSVAGQTRRLRHLLERISGGAIANLGRRWRDK